jgi:hypothetical protein
LFLAPITRRGTAFSNDIAAIDAAEIPARRLLKERPELKNQHYAVLITSEHGEEGCRAPPDIIHCPLQRHARRNPR